MLACAKSDGVFIYDMSSDVAHAIVVTSYMDMSYDIAHAIVVTTFQAFSDMKNDKVQISALFPPFKMIKSNFPSCFRIFPILMPEKDAESWTLSFFMAEKFGK
jgi:hypothetical protein